MMRPWTVILPHFIFAWLAKKGGVVVMTDNYGKTRTYAKARPDVLVVVKGEPFP